MKYKMYSYQLETDKTFSTSFQILDNGENGCACEAGWQGEKCDKCVPYWNCPNQNVDDPDSEDGLACVLPNQCLCKTAGPAHDDERGHLCNASAINGSFDDEDRK